MDTGTLDMLHDTGDQIVVAVTDGIDFHFGTHEVLVHQHGVFDLMRGDDAHVFPDIRRRNRR